MPRENANATVAVRYVVNDADAAVEFYTGRLGFELQTRPAPGFAALCRGRLRLLLNVPSAGGGGRAMPDGTLPEPGGWNRFQIAVDDIDAAGKQLRDHGASFRNEIVVGKGGKQVLVEDPAGNAIELFEPRRDP